MISSARHKIRRFARRLWVRATLISVLGVVAALAAVPIAEFIPDGYASAIGADAADNILGIIASSMLAVTTFSLSTVVSAYSGATSNVTPRATQLLIEDSTAQNTLAVFVGTFLYSLVTLILLSTGAYGEKGRVALFLVTLVVIVVMVATMLRWIDYLLRFGRVGETTENVERVATEALKARCAKPYLGGRPLDERLSAAIDYPVSASAVGYVQHVDTGRLSAIAEDLDCEIAVLGVPGHFANPGRALATLSKPIGEDDAERIRGAFTIGAARTFEQDPRFGLTVMAEIASRALSPATNDTGTAIDVIGRGVRVLAEWRPDEGREPIYPRLYVRPLELSDLLEDFFGPIGRDGRSVFEVQVRTQKALAALHAIGSADMQAAIVATARNTLARVDLSAFAEPDRRTLSTISAWVEQR